MPVEAQYFLGISFSFFTTFLFCIYFQVHAKRKFKEELAVIKEKYSNDVFLEFRSDFNFYLRVIFHCKMICLITSIMAIAWASLQ